MIDSETRLLCLLGKPVIHSKSPYLHNSLIKKYNLNVVYLAFKVFDFEIAVSCLKALNFLGANITLPFKSDVLEFLDSIDDDARTSGAVNTVLNKNEKLYGFNTDVYGIRKSLKVRDKKVLILGAGGGARAACVALKENEIVVVNRDFRRAKELEKNFNCRAEAFKNLNLVVRESDVVVNATPVGMYPNSDISLIPKEFLKKEHTVFDMIYNPKMTKLLKDANAVGAKTISGVEMFLHQGLKSFEIWTGIFPDTEFAEKVIS
ncbi:MAG: shikimate dehydrogenase [Candidatus Methanofastidiosia archaeon]